MKTLGSHIELVRELGLDPRIRRASDSSAGRVIAELVVGTALGCGLIGMLYVGGLALERLSR